MVYTDGLCRWLPFVLSVKLIILRKKRMLNKPAKQSLRIIMQVITKLTSKLMSVLTMIFRVVLSFRSIMPMFTKKVTRK